MRKFLIGCGVFMLLMIVAVCGSCYFIYRTASNWGRQIEALVRNVPLQVEETNRLPYDAPESIGIDPERLRIMIAVRRATSAAIRETKIYQIVKGKQGAVEQAFLEHRDTSQVFTFKEFVALMTNLKPAAELALGRFFKALNEERMSYAEYKYLTAAALSLLSLEARKLQQSGALQAAEAERLEIVKRMLRDFHFEFDEFEEQWRQADAAVYQQTLEMLLEQKEDVKNYYESLAVDLFVHMILTDPNALQNMHYQYRYNSADEADSSAADSADD